MALSHNSPCLTTPQSPLHICIRFWHLDILDYLDVYATSPLVWERLLFFIIIYVTVGILSPPFTEMMTLP